MQGRKWADYYARRSAEVTVRHAFVMPVQQGPEIHARKQSALYTRMKRVLESGDAAPRAVGARRITN